MTANYSPAHNDNQIDRVLNALRDAVPPIGMDRRILNILEAQSSLKSVIPSEATKSRSRGTPAFSTSRTPTILRWTTGTALAAITVAALITLTTRRNTSPTTTVNAPKTIPTRAPHQPLASATVAHLAPTTQRIIAPAHPTPPQHVETAQLIEDAQISHPAPPIPLTDQERLLLRYARHGRTEDLAQISNDRKAAREQQDAADFQAFFEPPIKIGESE
jgi:hypothetical protein